MNAYPVMETDDGNNQSNLLALLVIVFEVVLSEPASTTLSLPETLRLQLIYSETYGM